MPLDKTLLEDVLKVGENAFGTLLGARHEVAAQARAAQERVLQKLDLVTRREFDVAFAMLAEIRNAQEDLSDRLAAIESGRQQSRPQTAVKNKKQNLRSVNQINRKSKSKKRV